jgi:glycosyltransferase involved in cell wall biosynthesis
VAHDTIPVVSADLVPPEDSTRFVQYLTAVKFATRIAGVSAAARDEIEGFTHALRAQGLDGPLVTEVPLGSSEATRLSATEAASPATVRTLPQVLVVGSHEPRKNHLAILHCAERLWREGLEFTLTFIGGSGWGDDFPRGVEALQAKGRAVEVHRAVTDTELMRAYATASFTLFPSLHEGFGLPVVESLSHGTPLITSKFGATAEIGAGGGALLIDPRDDQELTKAMRTLLTDSDTLERLRREIRQRPSRGWDHYASELWDWLVKPVQVSGSSTIASGRDV